MTNAVSEVDTRWISDAVGPVLDVQPHPAAGRSRGIWLVTVSEGGRPVDAILRAEVGVGPWSGTPFTLGREARCIGALHAAGVRVPRVLAIAPDDRAMLQTRLPGSSSAAYADESERRSVMRSFLEHLAALHDLDPRGLGLPAPVPQTPQEHALLDLADYLKAYHDLCPPHAEFDATVDWLTQHAPTQVRRTSVVHGDAGPGNFMHEDGAFTGFLDLEMSHVGEPEDDLAWLWVRSQLLSTDPHYAEYLTWYEQACGTQLDLDRVDYYCVMTIARCAAANLYVNAHGVTGPRAGLERVLTWLRAAHEQVGGPSWPGAGQIPPLPGTQARARSERGSR